MDCIRLPRSGGHMFLGKWAAKFKIPSYLCMSGNGSANINARCRSSKEVENSSEGGQSCPYMLASIETTIRFRTLTFRADFFDDDSDILPNSLKYSPAVDCTTLPESQSSILTAWCPYLCTISSGDHLPWNGTLVTTKGMPLPQYSP